MPLGGLPPPQPQPPELLRVPLLQPQPQALPPVGAVFTPATVVPGGQGPLAQEPPACQYRTRPAFRPHLALRASCHRQIAEPIARNPQLANTMETRWAARRRRATAVIAASCCLFSSSTCLALSSATVSLTESATDAKSLHATICNAAEMRKQATPPTNSWWVRRVLAEELFARARGDLYGLGSLKCSNPDKVGMGTSPHCGEASQSHGLRQLGFADFAQPTSDGEP